MIVLVLCAHTDDESVVGGTIARFIEEGKEIIYAAFSICEKSVPPGFPKDILKTEVKKAAGILGIKPENLILFDYEVRDFPAFRQPILEDIVRLEKQFDPDLVILPSTYDPHQDHQVISQEAVRVFKGVSMIGYEMLRNNMTFPTRIFIVLTKKHIELKLKAISCYQSQVTRSLPHRFYENLAGIRGTQIGVEYAEAFEAIRWVVK